MNTMQSGELPPAAHIDVRDERAGDLDAVRDVHRQAFGQDDEGRVVDAIRANGAATVSLVATVGDRVVGHILFSPLTVGEMTGAGLGPMAVAPEWQRQGIGSRLVEAGVQRLRAQNCPFVVVIGHPAFYPKFGFQAAGGYGMTCEWDVTPEAFMVNVLDDDVVDRLRGLARYRPEFAGLE